MNLQNSKSILAKLLAAENITVSHQNTKTAYFDLKSRTLVCPVWKDMDGALYDLLMGHEVGHALNTPQQGWHDAIRDESGNPLGKFKGFLNVIEDARIEKQVKRKFPGLSKSFAAAYKGLYDRDFFGVKNIDVNKLNLIDRINLRCKMGAHIPVPFNDEERKFLIEVDNAETWDQVVDIARRVFDYCKTQEEQKIQNSDDLENEIQNQRDEDKQQDDGFGENEESDGEDSDDFDDGDADEELDEESDGSDSEDSDDESESDEETQDSASSSAAEQTDTEQDSDPESVTDKKFREREQELINESGEVHMIELPEANLEKIILKNQIVMNDLECFIRMQINVVGSPYQRNGISYETVAAKCVRKFNTNNKKFIMHILKEFEMRKKATDYARSQTAKTGELNMNALHNYKFTNDLFKKIQVVPKGKNHGMVLFLDMSGSMTGILRNTIEQLLVLASFCKIAKIPFDVYGFSNDVYSNSGNFEMDSREKFIYSDIKTEIDGAHYQFGRITEYGFHLKHLIGSSLSPRDYRRSFNNLCIVANEYYDRLRAYDDNDHGHFDYNWSSAGFGLNATPFDATLLASRDLINKFRAAHKLDIVNVIYLTDGEGTDGISIPWIRGGKGAVCYLVDKKSKKKVRVDDRNTQSALTQLAREVTGCKHLGFYLASSGDMKYVFRNIEYNQQMSVYEIRALKKEFRENKFISVQNLGYDNYFYIQSAAGAIREDNLRIDSTMTKNKMANLFTKTLQSKKNNRALVSQFAEEIASSLKAA